MSVAARRAPAALAALICCALLAAGCGGSSGDGDGARTGEGVATTATLAASGRPVTDEQALVLARVLQQNWQRGGATIAGSIPVHGATVVVEGRVDFRDGRGEMTLRDPQGQERRYAWTRESVRAQAEPGSRSYVAQAPDPDGDPVHAAIRFINLLSAETIDNTTNIKDQDARLLRHETLDDRAVDVYRYGADGNTTWWVDADDGLLAQVEAVFPDDSVLTIGLTDHGPVRIRLPRASG
ncbi:hypothetical protein [Conexibacter arvalis]|uniref:Gamma-glutamylcyclotransferase (GGCT)/AIG2-like uncharacterized protein YtfP n=1 Tax=Conexibacter arvalis TaxID=912552 RepID=A0A840IJW9_9ACTN|nr:hypothetical protein [Conexibacter arvalis]MBB4664228.1 gamma-glutamylcyclotransferase (GGCT)/AIG2-like uncharacterized protein YtfP [Conexibacter arvalis]